MGSVDHSISYRLLGLRRYSRIPPASEMDWLGPECNDPGLFRRQASRHYVRCLLRSEDYLRTGASLMTYRRVMFRRIHFLVLGSALLGAPVPTALALQPGPAMLRRLFEQELARRKREYSDFDARTAQAARDLGMFLSMQGDAASAQHPLAEAVRIDEKAFGPMAPQTIADVAELAGVSPAGQAEPLWRR